MRYPHNPNYDRHSTGLSKPVFARIKVEEAEAFERIARERGLTMSEAVRGLIRKYIESGGKRNMLGRVDV